MAAERARASARLSQRQHDRKSLMSLRVIGGSARGAKLKAVPGDSTRPIMDRVKEALFNIIGQDIYQACFLDLYAGTGSVGIEALSRGAEHVWFVDTSRAAIKTVRDNLGRTNLDESATVLQRNALEILRRPPQQAFRFIFVAPPQYQELWWETLRALDNNADWHATGCEVIVQVDPREYDSERQLRHLTLTDQRRYGNTLLLFYAFEHQ